MPQQTSREQGHATTHESLQVYNEIYTLLSAYLLDMHLRLLLRCIEYLQAFFLWAYLAPSRGAQRDVLCPVLARFYMPDTSGHIRSSSVSAGKAANKHLNDFVAPYIDWKPDWRFPEVSSSSSWSGDDVDCDTGCHAT